MLKKGLIAGWLMAVLALAGCVPAGTASEGQGSIWPMVIFLVVIFGLFYFVMIRPQRRRQRQHEMMVRELQKGDKVITAGGIYGMIEGLNEENILIKVESGAIIRVARGSVALRQEPPTGA